MDVIIRQARAEDDAAIGELLVDAFLVQYAKKLPEVVYDDDRKAALRSVAQKRQVAHVWVAEKNGKVIGTVAIFPPGAKHSEAWSPDAADLRHLATSPEVHGQGYSQPLMDVAEAKARELGARVVQLHVRRGAHGVGRLYLKRGYVRVPSGDLDKPNVYLEAYEKRL
jgi:N-acetylglutamate synthase-like GNAT family acetyltransferase